MDDWNWYSIGAVITWILAFLCLWLYAFVSWGLLIGLAIGWLPAMIGAGIIALVWPLLALLIVGLIILILN